jgi:hypothetical protein
MNKRVKIINIEYLVILLCSLICNLLLQVMTLLSNISENRKVVLVRQI